MSCAALALLLSGCANVGFEPVGLCKTYSAEFSNAVASEIEVYLPQGSATEHALADYIAARDANCAD